MVNKCCYDQGLYEKCKEHESQFIKDWEKLVGIDSPSCYGEGLTKVGNFVADKLTSLGAAVEIKAVANKDEGFNVVGTLMGEGKGSILLLAHMDTVLHVGAAAERPFRIDHEGKAYGPGVSDDKSGVALCLHAMQILQESGYKGCAKITLLANCQEENGSQSTRELIMKLAKEHDCVLCAEPGAPGDGVCVNRPGYATLVTEVKGLSSHTAYPWLGRNAADELANQVMHLIMLANKEKGTVVSTKVLEAGIGNTEKCLVPDYAKAVMDIHAYTGEEMNRVETVAAKLARKIFIPEAEVKSIFDLKFPPFAKSEGGMRLASLAQGIYDELGLSLNVVSGAAATDAGWASVVNDAVLCSLGPVSGGQNHSDKEWADAKTVISRLYMLVRMLMELGSNALPKYAPCSDPI